MALIEQGTYFTINRPRQYGKTTTLHFLTERLNKLEEYLPVALNFQGIDEQWHQSDRAFAKMFVSQIANFFEFMDKETYSFLLEEKKIIEDMDSLSKVITRLVRKLSRKLVLLIDEVDASSNYEPFLSFLGMLRTKYLGRMMPQHATFYSIVLAGVHDIKSLKYKLRNPEAAQYNSPWNIAIDFEVDMSFNSAEIAPMLEQYCEAEGATMDVPAIAERLHYHTAGYPFLVSKLCKNIADKILPQREDKQWTSDDVERSVQLLLLENNTNFDSLIKNLENHKDLYDLVFRLIIDGAKVAFNPDNPAIQKGVLYGIFQRNGNLKIHNRVYEQRIYNYMSSKVEIKLKTENYNYENQFYLANNELDVEKILVKFQQFMHEQHSHRDQDFLERQWRLVFLAFLKPIINGGGHDFKEVEISAEKRLDVVITFFEHKYIVELKRWYGEQFHQEGLQQLADYLDRQNAQKGYLVIFEQRTEKSWRKESISHQGKDIFAVWV